MSWHILLYSTINKDHSQVVDVGKNGCVDLVTNPLQAWIAPETERRDSVTTRSHVAHMIRLASRSPFKNPASVSM